MSIYDTIPKDLKVLLVHNDVSGSTSEAELDVLDQVKVVEEALKELNVDYTVASLKNLHKLGQLLSKHQDCNVVFNLYENDVSKIDNQEFFDNNLPTGAEIFGMGCTGFSTAKLVLAIDKAHTRRIFAKHKVPVARGVEVGIGDDKATFLRAMEAVFGSQSPAVPLIVKPSCADASEGIVWDKSVFNAPHSAALDEVWARIEEVRRTMEMPSLVEELVGKGELNVSVLCDPEPRVVAVAEIDFAPLDPGLPPIVDYEGKWTPESPMYKSVRRLPAAITEEARAETVRVCLESFRAVGGRDFGRVDLRFTYDKETGKTSLWILEVNPNPCISNDSGFSVALEYAGIPFSYFVKVCIINAYRRHLSYIEEK